LDNIIKRNVWYILLMGLLYFWECSCLLYKGRYRSTSTISNGFLSQ